MTRFLIGLVAILLVLTGFAFWQSSRSDKKAQGLAEELAASRFNERGTRLYAEGLKRELDISEKALLLRDAQYRSVATQLDKRKKLLMEIKDDACLDNPVPAGLFGSVQHTQG